MKNQEWYTLSDIKNLSADKKIELIKKYLNPGMLRVFKILGFEKLWGVSAEGSYIFLNNGRKILDMTGGNGVFGLGHNHPRVLEAQDAVIKEKKLELCKAFLSPYMAGLASNLATLFPGDLQYSFFCGSGAEAVEGALKLAEKHHGKERWGLAYTDHCFHGKSHAAMSVSSQKEDRKHFQLLKESYQVPYGDAEALERLFKAHRFGNGQITDICAFIIEPIHGAKLIFPPPGYFKKVRDLCSQYDVLLIVDEIYTGFGKTGFLFAFEAEGIIPDIVCYSKAFGGGKATIGGYTARKPIFLKAYGKPEDSMIHSSTFSGVTGECAAAIETLNVIKEEKLVERAAKLGKYLGERLVVLSKKYPERVLDVRGRGLLWGIELKPLASQINPMVKKLIPSQSSNVLALTGAIVMAELLHVYGILTYLGFNQRNLLIFSPPLIIKEEEIDRAVKALDKIFATNWLVLCCRFSERLFQKI